MTSSFKINEGMVLELQRMSTEDGPGIRTTVFMKGCSLKCTWCHNPESISFKKEIQWIKTNCIGCNICINTCLENALSSLNGEIIIDRDKCIACGICSGECPSGAIETIGALWTEEKLLEEILKDKAYFEKSSGGITISGGEPGMQADFVSGIFKKLRNKGIHTAFDTCGMCSEESLLKILPYSDMVLYDIKEIDREKHKEFTGSYNDLILKNLNFINNYMKEHLYPKKLWIRTPVIPETTATESNISGISTYLRDHSIKFDRWELCAFNNLCNDKYERLGKEWHFKNHGLFSTEVMERLLKAAKKSSDNPQNIIWTGSVKSEENNEGSDNKGTKVKKEIIDYCRVTSIATKRE